MEVMRYLAIPQDRTPKEKRRLEAELFAAMMVWCKATGITHLQAVLELPRYPTFMEMAPQTFPLGLPQPYGGGVDVMGGGNVIAVRCPVNDQAIDDLQRYGDLDHIPCFTCLTGFESVAA